MEELTNADILNNLAMQLLGQLKQNYPLRRFEQGTAKCLVMTAN